MSHSVTVTRTTTTTTTSAILINTGYLKSLPGLLKLLELALGIVCVGIVSYYVTEYRRVFDQTSILFFLLISVTCLITTFCLLLSCLISISTASVLPKTIFELIYHGVAFALYLAASLTLLIEVNKRDGYNRRYYEPYLAASIIGLVNAALYLLSTVFAYKNYRIG